MCNNVVYPLALHLQSWRFEDEVENLGENPELFFLSSSKGKNDHPHARVEFTLRQPFLLFKQILQLDLYQISDGVLAEVTWAPAHTTRPLTTALALHFDAPIFRFEGHITYDVPGRTEFSGHSPVHWSTRGLPMFVQEAFEHEMTVRLSLSHQQNHFWMRHPGLMALRRWDQPDPLRA